MIRLPRFAKFLVFLGLMTALFGCSTTPSHESTGQYVDDSVITTKVKAAMVDDMALKGFQIKVVTYQGVVQLSGFVDTAEHAARAAEVARSVKGVQDVRNDLIVK